MSEYKLSATLVGHEDDVRAVTFPKADEAITCSRDGTVRRWMRQSIEPPIFDASVCLQANGHVQTVAYLPPSATYPEGLIFSGGQDTVIEARKPESAPQDNAEALLLGHAHNVCALDVDPTEKLLVSGSWDKDARLWTLGKWETDVTLRGHEGSVWATLIYDSNTIITGCADTKIRVFSRQGKLLRTISASQDPVRALCKLPQGHASGADFASAGNDSFVRLWTLAGHQLASLQGHDSFIYSLSVTPDGHLVSCGEDRTLRIWQGTECIQTITHPATSVWSVAVCSENGDLITGASDRMARIFTRDPKRYASTQDMEQFEEAVRGSSIPQQALEQKINKEQLPGPDFLQQKKGTKEGQVQMIVQSDGAVTAHTWSAGAWVNVGTVVDAVGSSGKKVEYLGQEYDFVFDVDIEDGAPPLKLPYNLSQNPYEAATKFIHDNELPISYLDQVANFITTNTQGATIGNTSQPSQPDPWGSDARYRPEDANASVSNADPPRPPPSAKLLPQKTYLAITNTALPKLFAKIEETNAGLLSSGQKDVCLNPEGLSTLRDLQAYLEKKERSTSIPNSEANSPTVVDDAFPIISTVATRWPYAQRLPGLDLLRLLASEMTVVSHQSANETNIITLLMKSVKPSEGLSSKNHLMMFIRFCANIFQTSKGRAVAIEEWRPIWVIIENTINDIGKGDRNVAVAATTVWINYAVLITQATAEIPDGFELALGVLEAAQAALQRETDAEVVFRALVAIGTLLEAGVDEVKMAARDVLTIGSTVQKVRDASAEKRIGDLAMEIMTLLA